jgi:hypothetical protein
MTETDTPELRRLAAKMGEFIVKLALVAVVISACTIYAADWIIDSFGRSTDRTIANLRAQIHQEMSQQTLGGREFWAKIEDGLDRAADPDTDLPAEKKQKLLSDVRVIVARWRPFIDAAQSEMQKPPDAR